MQHNNNNVNTPNYYAELMKLALPAIEPLDKGYRTRFFDNNKFNPQMLLPYANNVPRLQGLSQQQQLDAIKQILTEVQNSFTQNERQAKHLRELTQLYTTYGNELDVAAVGRIQTQYVKMNHTLLAALNADTSWQAFLPADKNQFMRDILVAFNFRTISIWYEQLQQNRSLEERTLPSKNQIILQNINTLSHVEDKVQFDQKGKVSIDLIDRKEIFNTITGAKFSNQGNNITNKINQGHQETAQLFTETNIIKWLQERLQKLHSLYYKKPSFNASKPREYEKQKAFYSKVDKLINTLGILLQNVNALVIKGDGLAAQALLEKELFKSVDTLVELFWQEQKLYKPGTFTFIQDKTRMTNSPLICTLQEIYFVQPELLKAHIDINNKDQSKANAAESLNKLLLQKLEFPHIKGYKAESILEKLGLENPMNNQTAPSIAKS